MSVEWVCCQGPCVEAWTISDRFRVSVALSITSSVYAPFEPIYEEQDLGSGLMVVERGLVGCGGRLLRKGGVFGDDVFLNEDGKSLRGHNANSLTHAMVLEVPGETLHDLLNRYTPVQDARHVIHHIAKPSFLEL